VSALLFLAIPYFLGLLWLEARVARRRGLRLHEARDSAASLAMGLGDLAVQMLWKGTAFAFYFWLYRYRLFDPGTGLAAFALLFVAEDCCYYWFHRAHHEVRVLWAAHVAHHSSRRYHLATALRQTWTAQVTGLAFYAPLPLLGFHPALIAAMQAVSLVYQFWIHTELIDRLGPLEWVLNTPSHHRVHHGSNPRYLDRNHGGILIVWDRLFGTFEPEGEAVDYGLTKNLTSHSPWEIFVHEWRSMWRDSRAAASWRDALRVWLLPPGWSRDGSTHTANELRASLSSPQAG
jgi:sterol desaturase/sphingolipid hydroxylase (fatty acid hydroxylase superfamily)